MVILDIEKIKQRLLSVQKIQFSRHAETVIQTRRIDRDMIKRYLRNPERLEKVVYEEDKYPGEKFELYFTINTRKSLKIVMSFINQSLNVVTVHIILRRRLKWVEKWRKKRF